ncbi:MAG: hypothetical protein DMD61_09695 [Gemmatimonadetes bacterium]|nr:MAG: hypothetical protein DMD61_09695 [Gemmatimonadota bacterium]
MAARNDAPMTKDVEQQRHVETSRRTVEVKRRALELGFDAVGIATLEPSARATEFDRWLSAGYAGTMTYLHRQGEKRQFPARIMADARVAIVTLTNYFHGARGTQGTGKVAQYAWSTDYHLVLGRRLELLATALREIVPGATSRCYVDAGPVPERELAQRAGLGWIGKNTMLIRAPRVLDARRCISYLTIERHGEFTESERALVGDWLFGCDVCQDVCPWNVKFARPTPDAGFGVRSELTAPDLTALLEGDLETFDRRFGDTPFERPGAAGMRRNAAAVLRNLPAPG